MAAASLAILKLDTCFPRLPGDIASESSYAKPVRIHTIPEASVDAVVTQKPASFDLSQFEQAVRSASEPLITTSCGFMIYFQDQLSRQARHQFVSSSLTALPALRMRFSDQDILILTFDAHTLAAPAYVPSLGGFSGPVEGLDKTGHLYQTIKQDRPNMDEGLVRTELRTQTAQILAKHKSVKAIILECTNLSPYKDEIRAEFDGELIDTLSILDSLSPGLVRQEFLI